MIIYEFLKIILTNEFKSICQINKQSGNEMVTSTKDKKKKIRRKTIIVNLTPVLDGTA